MWWARRLVTPTATEHGATRPQEHIPSRATWFTRIVSAFWICSRAYAANRAEDSAAISALRRKAGAGVRVRLLFGDRDSAAVVRRSLEEGIGEGTISAKIDHALASFRPLADVAGVTIRVHGTTLYNSVYRFDDEMIVNSHVFGKIAAHAPAFHLRRLRAGDLFTVYEDSFAAVWDGARPVTW